MDREKFFSDNRNQNEISKQTAIVLNALCMKLIRINVDVKAALHRQQKSNITAFFLHLH
jgi:hypothetical protein